MSYNVSIAIKTNPATPSITMALHSWLQHVPGLSDIDDPAGHAVLASAQEVRLPADTIVFRIGDECGSD